MCMPVLCCMHVLYCVLCTTHAVCDSCRVCHPLSIAGKSPKAASNALSATGLLLHARSAGGQCKADRSVSSGIHLSSAISRDASVIGQQPVPLTIDKAIVQPESDKVCATMLHLLLVIFTCTGLTLGNLILMVWEDLQSAEEVYSACHIRQEGHCNGDGKRCLQHDNMIAITGLT